MDCFEEKIVTVFQLAKLWDRFAHKKDKDGSVSVSIHGAGFFDKLKTGYINIKKEENAWEVLYTSKRDRKHNSSLGNSFSVRFNAVGALLPHGVSVNAVIDCNPKQVPVQDGEAAKEIVDRLKSFIKQAAENHYIYCKI